MPQSEANSTAQRLPTHRRRSKVAAGQRKRVVTACNSCNLRRIKCSGEQPCLNCRKSGRECQYPPAADDKVFISRTELNDLKARCEDLQRRLDEAAPDSSVRDGYPDLVSPRNSFSTAHSRPFTKNADSPDEGRVLQDPDGTARFLGESSGAVFLDHLKEFMSTVFPLAFNNSWPGLQNPETAFIHSLGRYQTHDSRPLLVPNVDPLWLPSRTEASILLAEFRHLAQDGNGDFPCGGIYFWGDWERLLSNTRLDIGINSSPDLAVLNAAFAIAFQAGKGSNSNSETSDGDQYFARARNLLRNPLDYITIGDAAALGLLAFYLVERNRRDSAYMYVSIAVHVMIMHGVHKGWMVDELGKRIFWTIYILERRLSILMGRPPLISDLAINVRLPESTAQYPSASGLIAHVELSRISNYIVCNVYQIASQVPGEERSTYVEMALQMLTEWSQTLPPELQTTENALSTDRACCELHMAYNQLIILTIRPIYFVAVKKAVADRYINGRFDIHSHPHLSKILECSSAARRNLNLGQRISRLGRFPRLLHMSLHNVFNAAVILQMNQLLVDFQDETDEAGISFAISAFESEAREGNIYAEDCTRVLLDLNSLVQRLRSQSHFVSHSLETPGTSAELQNEGTSYDNMYPVTPADSRSYRWRAESTDQTAVSQITVDEQDPAYQQMMNWLNVDDLQLYNL